MATAGRTPRRRRHRRPLASAAATALTSTNAAAVTSADADRTNRSDCVGWSAVVAGIGFLPVKAMPAILQLKRWLPAGPSTSRLSSLTARDVRVHPGECLGRHLAYPPVPTRPTRPGVGWREYRPVGQRSGTGLDAPVFVLRQPTAEGDGPVTAAPYDASASCAREKRTCRSGYSTSVCSPNPAATSCGGWRRSSRRSRRMRDR